MAYNQTKNIQPRKKEAMGKKLDKNGMNKGGTYCGPGTKNHKKGAMKMGKGGMKKGC